MAATSVSSADSSTCALSPQPSTSTTRTATAWAWSRCGLCKVQGVQSAAYADALLLQEPPPSWPGAGAVCARCKVSKVQHTQMHFYYKNPHRLGLEQVRSVQGVQAWLFERVSQVGQSKIRCNDVHNQARLLQEVQLPQPGAGVVYAMCEVWEVQRMKTHLCYTPTRTAAVLVGFKVHTRHSNAGGAATSIKLEFSNWLNAEHEEAPSYLPCWLLPAQ
eukprot:1157459-Pelagomonas_calceolata.AAC.5